MHQWFVVNSILRISSERPPLLLPKAKYLFLNFFRVLNKLIFKTLWPQRRGLRGFSSLREDFLDELITMTGTVLTILIQSISKIEMILRFC